MNSRRRRSLCPIGFASPRFLATAWLCLALTAAAGGQVPAEGNAPVRRRAVAHPPVCETSAITTASGVIDLAVDDAYVYFGDSGGSLWRVVKSGGSPDLLSRMIGTSIYFLAIDASNLYFQAGDLTSGLQSVYVIPKSGGQPKLLVSSLRWALDMIPDGDWLYVLSAGSLGPPPWPSDGRIMRVRKDGTALETIASALRAPMAMRLDGDTLYFTEAGTSPADPDGGVRRVPKSGGAITTVATLPVAWALAQDGTSLYVMRVIGSDLGAVDVVSKRDGSVTPLLSAVGFEPIEPMEVVGGSLVFMNVVSATKARIEALPLAGGERRIVREFARNFPQFAADSCAVYFSTPSGIEKAVY